MKLHLGCGQVYLKGYTNIDFPPSEHTVQTNSVADEFADILSLRYRENSVDEVRLHHVFEHFPRPVAYALVASWYSWLKTRGIIRIEVPDFNRTVRSVISPFSGSKEKSIGLRHIFGSNEAPWAVHYEGWSSKSLSSLLDSMGFEVVSIKNNSYKGTYNLDITASKKILVLNKKQLEKEARLLLSQFLVDDSQVENRLFKIWVKDYNDQVEKTWAVK